MSKICINIATDFSSRPGARYRKDGKFSGQEFREDFLEKYFLDSRDDTIIEIILDGVEGYATSFLEEAFGGLARKYTKERCFKKLNLISVEDSLLIKEIASYIKKAND